MSNYLTIVEQSYAVIKFVPTLKVLDKKLVWVCVNKSENERFNLDFVSSAGVQEDVW